MTTLDLYEFSNNLDKLYELFDRCKEINNEMVEMRRCRQRIPEYQMSSFIQKKIFDFKAKRIEKKISELFKIVKSDYKDCVYDFKEFPFNKLIETHNGMDIIQFSQSEEIVGNSPEESIRNMDRVTKLLKERNTLVKDSFNEIGYIELEMKDLIVELRKVI